MFHEQVVPIGIGIREHVVLGIYGLLALLYVLRFRKVVLRTEYLVLLAAFFLAVLSILVDEVLVVRPLVLNYLLEDGFKFVAIGTWMIYFVRVSLLAVKQEFAAQQALNT